MTAASASSVAPTFVAPALSEQQQCVATSIVAIEQAQRQLNSQLLTLRERCAHVWVPGGWKDNNPYRWDQSTQSWRIDASAVCAVCGIYAGGWYCQEAPDHVCHYEAHDAAQDFCTFCGQPDERK